MLLRLALSALLVAQVAEAQQYDLLIQHGTVVDGTGAPRYRADVAIAGDRIALVSRTPIPRAP